MIDRDSEPGSWALALLHSVNIRVLPDLPLQRDTHPFEGGADTSASAFAPVLTFAPFHASGDTNA